MPAFYSNHVHVMMMMHHFMWNHITFSFYNTKRIIPLTHKQTKTHTHREKLRDMKRQDGSLRSASSRGENGTENLHGKTIGCMSGIAHFLSKYHSSRKFLTFGLFHFFSSSLSIYFVHPSLSLHINIYFIYFVIYVFNYFQGESKRRMGLVLLEYQSPRQQSKLPHRLQ